MQFKLETACSITSYQNCINDFVHNEIYIIIQVQYGKNLVNVFVND